MKLKHLISTAFSFLLITVPVLAAEPLAQPISDNSQTPVMIWGQVQEITKERIRMSNKNTQVPNQDIVLNLSQDSVILEPVNGAPRNWTDIQENETLYAYISPIMTKSLPPQSFPYIIICDIPADYAVPVYSEVQKAVKDESGKLSVLTSNDVVLHIDEKTGLFPYLTKNIVTPDDIYPGVRTLAWYSTVLLSQPAQATPSKVMVFPSKYSGWLSVDEQNDYFINGKKGAVSSYVEGGQCMLPLRAAAEELGCEVIWTAKTPDKATVLRGGSVLYTLTLGSGNISLGENEAKTLTRASVVRNGVTYLAANDLISLHNLKLEGNW